jgi:AbrB family looped-hinge helix DNA binding protein
MLRNMKTRVVLQERGQITLPKSVRAELRLERGAEMEVQVIPGGLLLKKPATRLKLDRWVGYLKDSFKEMGFETAEDYIAAIRRGQK